MASFPSDRPAKKRSGLYGKLPDRGPEGFDARMLEFADELRKEGMAVGTAEILDALAALEAIPWTTEQHFRSALAATIAKSQDDQFLFEKVFERFFFRAVEREAIERGLGEADAYGGQERMELDSLRERIANAIRDGSDGEMRDMARLAISAFGRQGEGSGVIGVDVQRIRRTLGLKAETDPAARDDPETVPQERLRQFERHLRRELERQLIERTQALPPSRPLREFDRGLPSNPLQDLSQVHRAVAMLKRRLATQGMEQRGRQRGAHVDMRGTMRASPSTITVERGSRSSMTLPRNSSQTRP